ncbi:DUF3164 family protein [Amphritea sp. 2_MG-2023]|uniref:DUF3164 family protein n=1 Tax=Amphritea TaxID=515417 RepID=UPI001C07E437|nr:MULTISPECIES: DUF3164 family protein [Amphritea]MBU2967082.1 DUF3164 family protein [Amphritea atlantica]MDO6419365.1 DUF3164 family protein [Amphritea sp. 2_MG-2023]
MSNPEQRHIPDGYLEDQAGRLVPVAKVKQIDLTRNELVNKLVIRAKETQTLLAKFKLDALDELNAFVDLSAMEYDIALGGKKGNVTLTTYDGRYKVQRSIADHLLFDERLQVAKELIDDCIHRWAKDSAAEIRVLVDHAFQVDKEGKISTGRVLGLRRLDIKDREWLKAMEAIADSIQITGSKTYIRLYERIGQSDSWKPIPLDIAAL